MKFYDVASRKAVTVPDKDVSYTTKKTKRGKMKFATANGPKGNKMFRIVGRG